MKTEKFLQSMNLIKQLLEEEDKVREQVIKTQRITIRICSEAIKSIHRKEFEIADKKIAEAKANLKEIYSLVEGRAILGCWKGTLDVAQELGEAIIFSTIVRKDEIPSIEECELSFGGYLLALGDVVGELRRYTMDCLRTRDLDNAQRAFEYMNFIYSELMTVDFPKMLIGSLRSKVDIARSLVHRTRGDLINSIQAYDLKESMTILSEKLDKLNKEKKLTE